MSSSSYTNRNYNSHSHRNNNSSSRYSRNGNYRSASPGAARTNQNGAYSSSNNSSAQFIYKGTNKQLWSKLCSKIDQKLNSDDIGYIEDPVVLSSGALSSTTNSRGTCTTSTNGTRTSQRTSQEPSQLYTHSSPRQSS